MRRIVEGAAAFIRLARLILAALALLLGVVVQADAAPISWGASHNISGDADVATDGTLVAAFNIGAPSNGGPGLGSTTVNGVPFAAFALSGTSSTSGDFTFAIAGDFFAADNDLGSSNPPFSNLSAGYQTMLSSSAGAFFNPFTLTMSGLTVGTHYEFEWWFDSSGTNLVFTTVATATNSVTLTSNTSAADGGLGQFAIGTFTADATNEVITFKTGATSLLDHGMNGFQLRRAAPEPASLALLSIGLAGLGFSRRKQ